MTDRNALPPEIRTQFLATFDGMGEALRTIERLAYRRGLGDEWDSLVRVVINLRSRVQHGPIGDGFEDAMEDLCIVYDAFVAKAITNHEEH